MELFYFFNVCAFLVFFGFFQKKKKTGFTICLVFYIKDIRKILLTISKTLIKISKQKYLLFSRGVKATPDTPKEKGPWAPDYLGGPGPLIFSGPRGSLKADGPQGPGPRAPPGALGGLKADGPQGPGASRPMGPMGEPMGGPQSGINYVKATWRKQNFHQSDKDY